MRELVERGARSIWLAGSRARGDATEHSDVDVGVIADRDGMGPGYRLERRDGQLLSVSWTTAAATRASFRNPAVLGAAVPGWRSAVLLHDPDGIGATLRDEARAWRWEEVAGACDRWVAEEVTGYAEEVHKLVGALDRGASLATAVQRNVLALRLAVVLSVHRRILYETENVLWDVVAGAEGAGWEAAQRAALAADGEPLAVSAAAALALYAHAAAVVEPLLDGRQRAVVAHARSLIGARIGTEG